MLRLPKAQSHGIFARSSFRFASWIVVSDAGMIGSTMWFSSTGVLPTHSFLQSRYALRKSIVSAVRFRKQATSGGTSSIDAGKNLLEIIVAHGTISAVAV